MAPPKKQKSKEVRFRHSCSIGKLISVNKEIVKNSRQLLRIKSTPFRVLLELPNIEISGYFLGKLVMQWDTTAIGVRCDNELLRLTPHDVACILGLRVGGIPVPLHGGISKVHQLVYKRWGEDQRLEPIHLEMLLRDEINLKQNVEDDSELDDFVRLYIAFACSVLLCPMPCKRVFDDFFKVLDEVDLLDQHGWGQLVHDYLAFGIQSAQNNTQHHNHAETRLGGCAYILQAWALEHCQIYELAVPEPLWPMVRKWENRTISSSEVDQIFNHIKSGNVISIIQPLKEQLDEDVGGILHESFRLSYGIPDSNVLALLDYKMKYEEVCVSLEALQVSYNTKCRETEELRAALEKMKQAHRMSPNPPYGHSPSHSPFDQTPPQASYYQSPSDQHEHGAEDPDVIVVSENNHRTAAHVATASNVATRMKRNPRPRNPGPQQRSPYKVVGQPKRMKVNYAPVILKDWLHCHIFYQPSNVEVSRISNWRTSDFSGDFGNQLAFTSYGASVTNLQALHLVYQPGLGPINASRCIGQDVVDSYLCLVRARLAAFPSGSSIFIFSVYTFGLLQSKCDAQWPTILTSSDQCSYIYNGLSSDCDMIFLPVVISGHYVLIVANVRNKVVSLYDSWPSPIHTSTVQPLVQWMYMVVCLQLLGHDVDGWKSDAVMNLPKQEDGESCGIYMLTFLVSLATSGEIRHFSQVNIPAMRCRMLLELMDNELLPSGR